MKKRIYRSRKDSTIAGVCGGMGEYFGIDPTFIRIIFVLLLLADGASLLAYIIAWIIIPQKPLDIVEEPNAVDDSSESTKVETVGAGSWNKFLPGGILVGIGVFFLMREHYWSWHLERIWPMLLIAVGVFLIISFTRQDKDRKSENQIEGGSHESS
ncbi:MAG: PspC domain-containing protein [candidate division Zixibacteria bacterium]|nr:PspC domain-containing protein [candidate division Zixibacteria bacterium]